MKDGFIKVAAGSVQITVADTKSNTDNIKIRISEADKAGVNLLVLPELCVTGYTCGDLFYSEVLLDSAKKSLIQICDFTKDKYPIVIIGLPIKYRFKLYNCAAVIHNGQVLALIPKTNLPNYGEFYEKRQFSSSFELDDSKHIVSVGDKLIPLLKHAIFYHKDLEFYRFGVELCEDLWAPVPPSEGLCLAGAMIIANCSASDEVISKEDYRRMLVNSTAARLVCGYVYCNADASESTQDMVFSGHHIISENGALLAENKPFEQNNLIITEFDLQRLANERHRITTYPSVKASDYTEIEFTQDVIATKLTRNVTKNPFVPQNNLQINERAEAILRIQSFGLKKRLEHTHAKTAVVGISGGLDSCLALLVMVRAIDLMKRPRTDIVAVTMPCFGTTKRTKSNAEILCKCLGVKMLDIDITEAVNCHFKDINHDSSVHDITFENSQARERTQVLMDIANKENGILVGTGDLSELALGWATYNGDQMSMYGVNSSVPKTLVRYIVSYVASVSDKELSDVLKDILDTPVSPELLPVDEDGNISQKTEDLVGPYELHDFFLYYTLRFGFTPAKILRLATYAYGSMYEDVVILKWLEVFMRRFFAQQFKRSCMPDGPKVGSVTLSPRGDWRMPSDASGILWKNQIDLCRKIIESDK